MSFGSGERGFPRARLIFSEGAGNPKLEISQVGQLPPVFFVLTVWGLEVSHQQTLFPEAKKMFEIKALVVSHVDI